MGVASLRMILCISMAGLWGKGAQASVEEPSLHILRDGALSHLIPKPLHEARKTADSSVRFALQKGSLKAVNFRIEADEDCGSPTQMEADDETAAELKPGVYQLELSATGFEPKEFCFIALAGMASTLQIGGRDGEELSVRQVLQTEQPSFQKAGAGLKKDSYPVLGQIVQLLKENSRIRRLEVAVHTDSGGKHWSNMRLTGERAQAIVAYLVRQGISPDRLEARGYGSLEPLVKESSLEARLKNRRVEFYLRDVTLPTKAMLSDRS